MNLHKVCSALLPDGHKKPHFNDQTLQNWSDAAAPSMISTVHIGVQNCCSSEQFTMPLLDLL